MLTHIVIWKYRQDVEQFARDEHVNLLRRLGAIIPQVQVCQLGLISFTCHDPTILAWSLFSKIVLDSTPIRFIPNTSKSPNLAARSVNTWLPWTSQAESR